MKLYRNYQTKKEDKKQEDLDRKYLGETTSTIIIYEKGKGLKNKIFNSAITIATFAIIAGIIILITTKGSEILCLVSKITASL